ncbi:MAG TPA: hypothetical protein VFW71_13200 [Actinomycetota bacterium]|nr:hypothetical protein [Actinomycetota bacterium]
MRFEPPERICFCLLAGPVPHVLEEFVLAPTGEGATSTLTYRGELGADLWVLGRIYGARIVRPVWEAAVRSTLDRAKIAVGQRGAAHRRRKPSS